VAKSIITKFSLLFYFLKKDIKSRYAGSGLGMVWTFLMPLIQIVLFWFVFSAIMKSRPYATTHLPYIYFLLSTFFFWLAFSEGLSRAANAILENAEMVKKVSFPNIVLPVAVTLSCYIHNMVGFILFIIVYFFSTSFSLTIVYILPVLFLQLLFSLGLGMLFSALIPYVRDIGQILGQILQGLFFLSPIIYSIESVPKKFSIIFYFNPITYFASSYHKIILLKEMPSLLYIVILLFLSIGSFIFGYFAFKRLREGFSDVL